MSYIGNPFKYDVSISYSHGDPAGKGDSRFKGYSRAFIRELVAELKAEPDFGADLQIFFDESDQHDCGLDPMAGLTPQLRAAMGSAAVFIVLMSRHYLRSQWCHTERGDWFSNPATAPFAHSERLALARIWETSEDWPAELKDERGYPLMGVFFYDRARLPDYKWPYAWPKPDLDSPDPFRREMLTLVGSIWRQLTQLKLRVGAHRQAQVDAARLRAQTGQAIYLHARDSERAGWDAAGEILSQAGFTIVPSSPEPIERDPVRACDQREHRVNTMSGCDALLLVGSRNGGALEEDLFTVGFEGCNSARALSRRPLPCALLDTFDDAVAIPRRRQFAKGLGVDWLTCRQRPWVPTVQQWLTFKGTEAAGRSL